MNKQQVASLNALRCKRRNQFTHTWDIVNYLLNNFCACIRTCMKYEFSLRLLVAVYVYIHVHVCVCVCAHTCACVCKAPGILSSSHSRRLAQFSLTL